MQRKARERTTHIASVFFGGIKICYEEFQTWQHSWRRRLWQCVLGPTIGWIASMSML